MFNMHTTNLGFQSVVEVKKFNQDAIIPSRATEGSAGYDLSSVDDVNIPPRGMKLIDTGIGVRIPYGTYARVAPRSGMSVKGTVVGAGVVDADWRGAIKVVMFNMTDNEITVEKGNRIAQLIFERIDLPVVKEVNELGDTQRGSGGFGSTGK
jgi:dUTP pyrophosphatase